MQSSIPSFSATMDPHGSGRLSKIPPLTTDLSHLSSTLSPSRPSTAPFLSVDHSTSPPSALRRLGSDLPTPFPPPSALSTARLTSYSSSDLPPSPRRIPPLSPTRLTAQLSAPQERRLAPLTSASPLSATRTLSAIPPLDAPTSPLSPQLPHPFGIGVLVTPAPVSSSIPAPFAAPSSPSSYPSTTDPTVHPFPVRSPSYVVPDIASLLAACGAPHYAPSFYATGHTDVAALLSATPQHWDAVLDAVAVDLQIRIARLELSAADVNPSHRARILAALRTEQAHFTAALLPPAPAAAGQSPSNAEATKPALGGKGSPTPAASADAGHAHFEHFCHVCRHWLCCFSLGAVLLILAAVFYAVYRELRNQEAGQTDGSAWIGFDALCGVGFGLGALCLLLSASCWVRWPEHRRCGAHGPCGGCGPAEGVSSCCGQWQCEMCVRCEEEWDDRDCCRGEAAPAKWPTCPTCPQCPTFGRPACCQPSTKPGMCSGCAHLTLPTCCEKEAGEVGCMGRMAASCKGCWMAVVACLGSCCTALSACCATIKWPQCGCGLMACMWECGRGCVEQVKCRACDGCMDGHCCAGGGGGCSAPSCSLNGCSHAAVWCQQSTCYKVVCCRFQIHIN